MDKEDGKRDNPKIASNSIHELREHAEDLARKKVHISKKELTSMPLEEIMGIIHELDVHQIELELQNEELRRAQEELEAIRKRYFELYEFAPVGYLTLSEKGIVMQANLMVTALLGLSRSSIIGKKFVNLIAPENQETYYFHQKKLSESTERSECEIQLVKNDGSMLWVHLCCTVIREESGDLVQQVVINEITQRKKAEEEIQYLNYHDFLTGIYNRRFYEEQLMHLNTINHLPLTLVMIDINGLKLINDSFGHLRGDEFLKKTAEVIKKGCRKNDIAARLGGDEFVMILPKTSTLEAEHIIDKIKEQANEVKIEAINLSISFGCGTKHRKEENIQEVFKKAEDTMYQNKLYQSASMRSQAIEIIINTLYEKSQREMHHSKRVSAICAEIASKMNFDQDHINQMKIAGLLHDIGKMGISEEILNKAGKLTDEEWKQMKRHSEIGYRILSSANEFSEIANYILEHQEKWDGSGYPNGLKGKEISLEARIIAIADAYDAMTSDRTYRKKMNVNEAIEEIQRYTGIQFDPEIVEIFVQIAFQE